MDLELVDYNDPILLQPCHKFDMKNPPFNIVDFSQSLVDKMLEKNGLGLAANQVGIPYSVFAMRGEPENFVCFNPKIVQASEEVIELEESCLSYPGLIIKIERPRHVRMRFTGPNGEVFTRTFANMTSRCVFHEMCHLEGRPFWDGISKTKFNIAKRKAKKYNKDYSNLTYKGI